ncbi:MAG: SPOR domain-containing protein [Candidatus Caldatribacterium sp.]|uniref:SPOR domain-containing protein n=1 Tax=Candidatus Caldatribacterium sp. TaxID=2282143 RepID=UPI00299A6056|nr:SPOR domain-containing protein [Candidatus Caldatribacterium sp.]MCX7730572.1 SPOR domain-containing protein [Candidatus Caldatribacterium sp.]MDW8080436.1 SPOR domain-containing protein [Candidatus Calescibacterium sp.]
MKFLSFLRRRDPVEIVVILCGAVLVVVFAFFTARGDLNRYVELLTTREIPPLVEIVEKEEIIPVSPLEQWAREFPEVSPLPLEPSPLPREVEAVKESAAPSQSVQRRPSPSPIGGVFLQAGAFSQEKNAQAMVDTLRRFGYNAVIERASGMYRVRVYGFSSLEEAKKVAAKLRSQGIECFAGK